MTTAPHSPLERARSRLRWMSDIRHWFYLRILKRCPDCGDPHCGWYGLESD